MVVWVAVGGRGTLVGAIIATLLVNFGRTFFSENFPEIWLFFQGALFLLVFFSCFLMFSLFGGKDSEPERHKSPGSCQPKIFSPK